MAEVERKKTLLFLAAAIKKNMVSFEVLVFINTSFPFHKGEIGKQSVGDCFV